MFKVHKFSQATDAIANDYCFKRFTDCSLNNAAKEIKSPKRLENSLDEITSLKQRIKLLQEKANSIIAAGEAEAKAIIENANREAANILNSSSIQGYKKGLELANKKTEEIIQKTTSNAAKLIENSKLAAEAAIEQFENEILEFSFGVAEKILNLELNRNDETIIAIVKKALKKLKSETTAKIIVNSDNLQILNNSGFIGRLEEDGAISDLTVAIDEGMGKGGIIIETEKGSIDASVSSQLACLKNALYAQTSDEV